MSEILFVGTKEGVAVARREGDTWLKTGHGLAGHQVNSVSVRGGILLAGTRQGIYRSDDHGQSWQEASKGLTEPHVRWLEHHPDSSGTVLAGTEPAALYLSRDGGQTWSQRREVAELRDRYGWYLPYSPEAGCIRGFAFAGDRLYAAAEVGGLLRSDDGGETWQLARGSSGQPHDSAEGLVHPDVHSVAVHPSSPDLVYAPTGGGLYRSLDGGDHWEQLYSCYCRAVWTDPSRAGYLLFGPAGSVDRKGRIEMTLDDGQTWQPASDGLEVPWPRHMVERFLPADRELLAILSNGDLLATPLETLTWQAILPEVDDVRALAMACV
jgi:photosystem II stability/assembly factor-like uncharacterized protein